MRRHGEWTLIVSISTCTKRVRGPSSTGGEITVAVLLLNEVGSKAILVATDVRERIFLAVEQERIVELSCHLWAGLVSVSADRARVPVRVTQPDSGFDAVQGT